MHNTPWLLGLVLAVTSTLAACSTATSLGREGEDSGRPASDTGQTPRPETGCTYAPVSLDLSCNDDPNLPTVAGGCQTDGTCWCARGFVLNPVSKRCKLDTTVDGGAVICSVGADQTCNDEPWASWVAGTCEGGVACACKTGYLLNLTTRRCKRAPSTDAGSDATAGQVCTFLLDQTCNDDDAFSGIAGRCMKGFTCACNDGFVINPATGRCRKTNPATAPDASVTTDGPVGQTCHWQDWGYRYSSKHFRFLLTTPDGQAQVPPKSNPPTDGGWPINDFQGRVVEKSGNQLTIDSCLNSATCQPSLYRFVLCEGGETCSAQPPSGGIELSIPVGVRVRVVWHIETDHPTFCPGLFWLAIHDAEPGDNQGRVMFLGSGGHRPGESRYVEGYQSDLPFSMIVEALQCGKRDAGSVGDDYRFVFSPNKGTGSPLKLGTGENGVLEFAAVGGPTRRLQVHCLDAVQTGSKDDYWNWDFWMAAASTSTPVDAGSRDLGKDAPGVCTFGKNQTCNDSEAASWIAGTCQSDGTCVCGSGYVLVPSSGRCALAPRDAGPDSKMVCTPGSDQTCNDSPASALWGVCLANGTCSCTGGSIVNSSTGKCMRPEVTTCAGNYTACGCGCCPGVTPAAVCYYPSAGDSLSTIKSTDEAASNSSTCALAGCSLGQRYLCCTEAAADPAGSATYSAVYQVGGYDRISLNKTGNDGICMSLTLVNPGSLSDWRPLRMSVPTNWGVEGTITAGACNAGTTEQSIGAQGTVTFTPNGTSCALNAHLTVFTYADASGTLTTRRLDVDNVPITGGAPSGFCK